MEGTFTKICGLWRNQSAVGTLVQSAELSSFQTTAHVCVGNVQGQCIVYGGPVDLAEIVFWDIRNLFTTPYANVWTDYNLPVYALKSSLFGEFQFTCYGWIPAMLLFFNVVQALLCICAMVHYIKWKEKDRERNFCLLAAGILWMGTVFFTCGILSDAAWISAICCFCRFRLPCCSAGGKHFIMDIRRRYNGWPGFGASALP